MKSELRVGKLAVAMAAAAAAGAPGCGGSSSSISLSSDAASHSSDSSVDASEASPTVCTRNIAEGCTPNPPFLWGSGNSVDFSNCPPTLNDAIAVCITYAGDFGYQQTDCGAYRRWHVENADVGCSYYYDATSGDLVAVFCTDFMGNTTCLGGPPRSTEPECACERAHKWIANGASLSTVIKIFTFDATMTERPQRECQPA